MPTLLVADQDPVLRSVLGKLLASPGRAVLLAGSAPEALALAGGAGPVDVALLDRGLGDGSGLELAAALKARRPETEVILLTSYASFESALEALQVGAYDYLSKPIDDFDGLALRVDNAFAKLRLLVERREAERGLRHLQKMDAIGRLAGGIGHDLANMLAVINSWVAELAPPSEGSVREGLQEIQSAADRATRLVRSMMTLSRKGPAEPVPLSLNQLLEDVAKLLRRSLGDRVELAVEPAPDLWPVLADPSLLAQVCLNLAVNARDAMPGGGRVTFQTGNLAAADLGPGGERPRGEGVVLTVRDQGVGMTDEVRERIFEPFFTTKGEGQGTGLGLAIVYGIVRQAGGTIRFHSEEGRGTAFELLWPSSTEWPTSAPAPATAPAARPGAPARPKERVLLVEDDAQVRDATSRALRLAGYQVAVAGGGDEALALVAGGIPPPQLLLTDVVMPGMNGRQVADAVRAAVPGVRVLFMSGYAGDIIVHHGVVDPGLDLLEKPFTTAVLLERVRMALDR